MRGSNLAIGTVPSFSYLAAIYAFIQILDLVYRRQILMLLPNKVEVFFFKNEDVLTFFPKWEAKSQYLLYPSVGDIHIYSTF